MRFLQHTLRLLDASMKTPGLFGWFHLLWLGITAAATIMLCRYGKGKERTVILWTTLLVIFFEIYKQINFSFSYTKGITFDYQWYAFPFQFCSTPMYVGLLAALTKGKLHKALCSYLSTFALFAGLCVMFYPGDVFIDTIGINIQTMICHGSMVVIGSYLLSTGYVQLTYKTVLKALPVFAVCVFLATGLNELAHITGLKETFNMFFVSPYWDCTLPLYNLIHESVPFPLNLVIYIAGFTVAAWIVLMLAKGFHRVIKGKTSENAVYINNL